VSYLTGSSFLSATVADSTPSGEGRRSFLQLGYRAAFALHSVERVLEVTLAAGFDQLVRVLVQSGLAEGVLHRIGNVAPVIPVQIHASGKARLQPFDGVRVASRHGHLRGAHVPHV